MHLTNEKTVFPRPALRIFRFLCGAFSRLILTLFLQTLLPGTDPALGQVAVRLPDNDWDVYSLVEGPRALWIAQSGSVYFIENGEIKSFASGSIPYVNSLSILNGKTWLATRHGAYLLDDGNPKLMSPDWVVRSVQLVDQEVWLATDKGAYPLTSLKRTPDQELDVYRIEKIEGEIWLATRTGAFRTDGTNLYPVAPDLKLRVHAIKSINGKVWLGTETGLYIYDGTLTLASDKELYINDIVYIDNRIWLATLKGLYLVEANGLRQVLTQEMDVKEIRKIGGKIWLGAGHNLARKTPGGVYRLDEDVVIAVKPTRSALESLLQKVFGNTWLEGVIGADVGYVNRTSNKDPYGDEVNRQFDVIMAFTDTAFEKAVRSDQYSPVGSFERYLPSGGSTIYMSARDKWGNKFTPEPIAAWAIPNSFFVYPFLLALLWWGLLAGILCLAPYNRFCLRALMNPVLRKYGSFGFVPLIITLIPVARRHLLKRYLHEITRYKEFAEWQTRYVLPAEEFSAGHVAERLRANSILFLEGESGIGKTSYFKYLVGCFAANREYLPHVVPVFLPLKRHQGKSLKEIFTIQLKKYGDLTDEDLIDWFLSHGDFLIFIDGLNEVDEATVKDIVSFVDGLEKVNYFYLSSQGSSPLDKAEKIALPKLQPDKIEQILRLRLDKAKADVTIKQFDDGLFKMYGIPQELELAIDLIKQGLPLPRSTMDLYEASLTPILDSWKNAGVDYEKDVSRMAYEMLAKGVSSFEDKGNSLSVEILDVLVRDKLLFLRGGRYHFRHDLIRAYLAAKHLAPRWQDLINDSEPVRLDVDWNSAIKFVTLVYDNTNDAKQLLFAVLKKNSQVAKDVFNWLEEEHPQLVEDWSDEFDLKYGRAIRTVPR